MKKKIVVLSGAGLDAESDIATFRSGPKALWANHKIEDVCTATAWNKNPTLVNDFYNMRRIEVLNAAPNKAHIDLAQAETLYDIVHITTNVSDLLERAGCTNVLHLHGHLLKARTSREGVGSLPDYLVEPFIVPVGQEGIKPMQEASDGHLLRPHIVLFEENVPNMSNAIDIVKTADILIVVGTSLQVYPAASLVWDVKDGCKVFYVDPTEDSDVALSFPCQHIKAPATSGISKVLNILAEGNFNVNKETKT